MSGTAIATSSSKPPATAVASAVVKRVEQRLSPRKHFAYVIQMGWNNDEDTYALRSHLELFHFQVSRHRLMRMFDPMAAIVACSAGCWTTTPTLLALATMLASSLGRQVHAATCTTIEAIQTRRWSNAALALGKHAQAKTADKALKYIPEVQTYLQQLFNLPPEVEAS